MATSTSSEAMRDDCKKTIKDGMNLIVTGKRFLVNQDYFSATEALENAVKIFNDKYGTIADECAEPYLLYGTSLLELARQETGAFGGVVKTDDSSENEDSEEDEEEENEKNDEEKSMVKNGNENLKDKEKKEDEEICDSPLNDNKENETFDEKENQGKTHQSGILSSLDQPSTSAGPSAGSEEQNKEDDEASNFEISWEVLTMASEIFRKMARENNGPDCSLKLAETLSRLGEIAIEWENNERALEFLGESLAIRNDLLPEDDRLIAETFYHLGISHSFMSKMDAASSCFKQAIEVIEKRIKNLLDIIDKSSDEDEKYKAEREVRELKDLLPDMIAKIEDSKDQMLSAQKVSQVLDKEDEQLSCVNNVQQSDSKPISNISHLIKRKRCDNGDAGESDQLTKKLCQEEKNGKINS